MATALILDPHINLRCQHVISWCISRELHDLWYVSLCVSHVVGTIADIRWDLLHSLGVKCTLFLWYCTPQLLIDGSEGEREGREGDKRGERKVGKRRREKREEEEKRRRRQHEAGEWRIKKREEERRKQSTVYSITKGYHKVLESLMSSRSCCSCNHVLNNSTYVQADSLWLAKCIKCFLPLLLLKLHIAYHPGGVGLRENKRMLQISHCLPPKRSNLEGEQQILHCLSPRRITVSLRENKKMLQILRRNMSGEKTLGTGCVVGSSRQQMNYCSSWG